MIREELSQAEPGNLALQSDVAYIHDWLGKCCRKLGDSAEALQHYQKSYDLRQSLLRSEPEVVQRQLDLLLSQMKLATWHLDQATAQEDGVAADLLKQVEQALLTLQADGRLAGQESAYATWLPAVRQNQALIAERARQRDAAVRSADRAGPSVTIPATSQPTTGLLRQVGGSGI